MDKHIIKRDGLPPIAFTGLLIGSGDNKVSGDSNRASRWTEVEIYRTKGGRYIASVKRLTCWQGESDSTTATSVDTPAETVRWLQGDNDTLGAVSQEAVENAAKEDPAFAAAWVEQVD